RNTRRHAGAGAHVSVDVRVDSSGVQVVVADDGVGFDPDQVPSSRLGIAVSIRRRMEALNGGSAQLLSAPGAGTIVVLEWGR
nr:ATP-binding protein [Gordonia sp. (in: high G+C Gram-positive bacteria)]